VFPQEPWSGAALKKRKPVQGGSFGVDCAVKPTNFETISSTFKCIAEAQENEVCMNANQRARLDGAVRQEVKLVD
jgi:hypothetical protein